MRVGLGGWGIGGDKVEEGVDNKVGEGVGLAAVPLLVGASGAMASRRSSADGRG